MILSQYEAVIEHGLQTFVDVGNALMAIRDGHLYPQPTFEDYCRERWGWTRRQADRLVVSAEVVKNLRPMGLILPDNERQTRPLSELPPQVQSQAWQEAVETAPNGRLTAAHVAAVVATYQEPATVSPNEMVIPETDEILDDAPEQPVNRAYKNSSDTPEWYTPKWVIDFAHHVLGEIDLDPASCEVANRVVQAKEFFDTSVDGLKWSWCKPGGEPAQVWLNPPYQRNVTILWIDKLLKEYQEGHIGECLVLIAARTETQWFRKLKIFPRCFIEGRIEFIKGESNIADDEGNPAGFPSVVIYLGKNVEKFAQLFSRIGDVYTFWEVQ